MTLMKKLIFFLLLVLIFEQIQANNGNNLPDSLVVMLETNTKNDIKRVDALVSTICFLFDENKVDESEKYVNELYQISRNLHDDWANMLGEYYKGTFYTLRKDSSMEAIQCLLTARNIAASIEETELVLEYKIRIYISLCANYINCQMYTEAFQCIETANEWNSRLKKKEFQYILDNNTLIIYSAMGKHSESIKQVKDFIINNKGKDPKSLFNLYLSLAGTYMEMGRYDSAMIYLDTIKLWPSSPYETALVLSYQGCAYNGLENYQTAVDCFMQSLDAKEFMNTELEVYSLGHLSNSYFKLNEYDSAFYYIDKAIEISKAEKLLKWEVGTLEQKCDYLLDREMYKEHSENIVIYNKLNDSLKRVENLNELDKLFLQRQFTDVENQLKQEIMVNKIKHEHQRMVMIFVIIVMLAVILIVLLLLNRKNILLKSKKIKEEAMSKELEMRNRELASNVVILMKKNEVFADILNRLIIIKDNAVKDETKDAITRVSKDLEKTIETKFWDEFEVRFKNVHSDFYQRLMEKYPGLTTSEVRLCSFLKLDLSTKDISSITGQSVQSIEKARNRLRKKLGIGNDPTIILTSFVQKI